MTDLPLKTRKLGFGQGALLSFAKTKTRFKVLRWK
jgi:hypothetical protein